MNTQKNAYQILTEAGITVTHTWTASPSIFVVVPTAADLEKVRNLAGEYIWDIKARLYPVETYTVELR